MNFWSQQAIGTKLKPQHHGQLKICLNECSDCSFQPSRARWRKTGIRKMWGNPHCFCTWLEACTIKCGGIRGGEATVPRFSELQRTCEGKYSLWILWGWLDLHLLCRRREETPSALKSKTAGHLSVTGSITSCLLGPKGEVVYDKQRYK